MNWLKRLINWIFRGDQEEEKEESNSSPRIPSPGAGTGTAGQVTRHPVETLPSGSGGQPAPTEPSTSPSIQKVSTAHSFIKITPDDDWRDSPTAGQHEAGDQVRIEIEVRDANRNPLGGIKIRGVINLQTGKPLGVEPEMGVTKANGYAEFFYKMKSEDVGKSKLITAVLIDESGNTLTLKPAVLS